MRLHGSPSFRETRSITRRELLIGSFLGFPWFHRAESKLADIRFRVIRKGRSGRRYLLIHGDEETARKVLTDHMDSNRGIAHLVAGATRNVPWNGGELDPNRLFSDIGADRNLRTLNPSWSDEQVYRALAKLDRKRHELINAVKPDNGDVLIAVHNNGPGYSVSDEVPISDRTALNDAEHPHEFCLCTDPSDFERLAKGSYNVVLQNAAPPGDDGSLSRLAARSGFRYVNIEASRGQYDRQRAILEWVEQTLPNTSNR